LFEKLYAIEVNNKKRRKVEESGGKWREKGWCWGVIMCLSVK
jgi:hypothetical protein